MAQPSIVHELPLRAADRASIGLRALDQRVCAADAAGVILVGATDGPTARAVEKHLARRIQATGRQVLRAHASAVDSCWRDLAARLGVRDLSHDPVAAAQHIVTAAERSTLIVTGCIARGSWDAEVQQALRSARGSCLLVILRDTIATEAEPFQRTDDFKIEGTGAEEAEAWWRGIVDEALENSGARSLRDLDIWWSDACRRVAAPPSAEPSLSSDAADLLRRLLLTARAWPLTRLSLLGTSWALDELVNAGLVRREHGYAVASVVQDSPVEAPREMRLQVAKALEACFSEASTRARAGSLYLAAGEPQRGERLLEEAVRHIDNPAARAAVWDAWQTALGALDTEERRSSSVRAARLALDRGDVDEALTFARSAVDDGATSTFEAALVLGQALLARGDLVAAHVALDRAHARATAAAERSRVLAQLAEALYGEGNLENSQLVAVEAVALATEPRVRLDVRNTLGKILLARAQWDEAESHFAGDESDAACAGLELAQLRARVNRAIALLSKGRSETARTMLSSVLQQGEAARDLRAVSFAVSNLAVLAIDRHDYAEALRLSERAIDVRRQLGDKVGLARVITNLAELRLRLGLIREAEQALVFGRQTVGPGMPPTRAAHLALVAARVKLAKNETLEAAREIGAALADVAGSSDGAMIGECHRVAARIALEDGDTARAENAVRQAALHATAAYARAEVALLQARLAQCVGHDALDLAETALGLARNAADDDLVRECFELLCALSRIQGDPESTQRYFESAKRLRDQVADALPPPLRASYLARRDMQHLASLEHDLHTPIPCLVPAVAVSRAPSAEPYDPSTRFLGEHASVKRLLAAVRKIARSSTPVLIHGESGTGKELLAEAVHVLSERSQGPLIKVNCAALVETLLLSELFGHEKGAFTGAAARRRGRFELAHGGTIFLDEIGDISPRTQVALLRVLQDHTFERVGGTASIRSDVRIVCATNRDLPAMVADGTFREDLYYRLAGITLEVPALRTRGSDIAYIAHHLLIAIARERAEAPRRLSPAALGVLERHTWPGNVRELDNVLRAASLFTEQEEIYAETILEHLQPNARGSVPQGPVELADDTSTGTFSLSSDASDTGTSRVAYDQIRRGGTSLGDLKRIVERDCIQQALVETAGNITRAATLLGMKRPRLSQLVKQYGLLDQSSEDF